MVFIVLGAVKAAKHARNEYNKDKKRNMPIAPVDGSHDMMADRHQSSSSQSRQPGCTDWWGTCRAADAPAPTCDATLNANLVGAWSRDQPAPQGEDGNAARPAMYASSASASTELSMPIPHSPRERSASLSHLDAVKPQSQGSGDVDIRTRPASMDTPSKRGPGASESDGQLPIRRASAGPEAIDETSKGTSLQNSDMPSRDNDAAVPVKSMEEVERKGSRPRDRAKTCVQGSFAEVMQKPTARKPTASTPTSHPNGETISALARNASKGLRRNTTIDGQIQGTNSQVPEAGDGTLSAFSRNATRDHRKRFGRRAGGLPSDQGKDSAAGATPMPEMAPQSALARKASKEPRTRFESLANGSAGLGSDETNLRRNDEQERKQDITRLVAGQPTEIHKGVSAFAGAPTKKRSKRLPRVNPDKAEHLNLMSEDVGTSHSPELQTKPMRSSAPVIGSSMYAAGTMKKRNSRR